MFKKILLVFSRARSADLLFKANPKPCPEWCGLCARVTLSASLSAPGQARVLARSGLRGEKIISVIPADPKDILPVGCLVFLVEQADSFWLAIRKPL